jgi:HSP20 family protein
MSNIQVKEEKKVPSIFTDFFGRDFFSDDFFTTGVPISKYLPAANVKETPDSFALELSAPGYQKGDFSVRVSDDQLTIEARNEEDKKEENERYTRREFRTSSFSRTFRLPDSVFPDKIQASYENGLLKLVLPKKDGAKKELMREVKIS